MEPVLVDHSLGRVLHPVRAPLTEVLAGKLFEDQSAQNAIERRAIEAVRRDDVIIRIAMLELEIELHRFPRALEMHRQGVARERLGRDQVRKLNLAVERVDVVSVLIDLAVAYSEHDVAHLQPRFRGRRIRIDARHIHPRGFARLLRELPQLRIAGREKSETGRGKTLVRLLLRVLQEVRDDRRRDRIDHLGPLIEPQKQRGELVVFHERHRVAVVAVLERDAHAIRQELAEVRGITRHLNRRDQPFGQDERAGGFELQGGEPIADDCVERELQRRQAVEKFFVRRFEQCQVRFVIDHDDIGRRLVSRFRALQLDVVLVGNQVRRHEDSAT